MGFIFCADLHMSTVGFRPQIPAEDGFLALNNLVDVVLELRLPMVIGGDIFDVSKPPPWVINQTCRILSKVVDSGLYFIQGNHDKHLGEAWLDGLKGAVRLGAQPTEVSGHQLVGIDACSSQYLLEQVEELPSEVEIVCHQAFRQGLGFDGSWNADLDDKPWHRFKNIWVGDLHHSQVLFDKKKRVQAVYPGSIWPRSVSEADCASYAIVGDKLDKKGHYEVEIRQLPRRPIIQVSITSEEKLEELLEDEAFMLSICRDTYQELPEWLRKPVIYIKYYKDIVGVESAFTAALDALGGGYLIEEPLPARNGFAAQIDQAVDVSRGALTLAQIIHQKAGDHQNVRDFGVELAECRDMNEVRMKIDEWRDKILNKKEDNK